MSKKNDAPQESGAADALPLFYKTPVPLDVEKHKTWGMVEEYTPAFAKNVNAVPINMIEMPHICHFYPIAFSPDENATPVALLGLRDNENLFVTDEGQWATETYVPAYVRRYPFIFSETTDGDQLALCVDTDSGAVDENAPEERRFFTADDKPTTLSENVLEFCKSYHAAAQQTLIFGKAIAESDLLVERQAELDMGDGKRLQLSGFRVIDEEKLAAVPDETFLDWRQKGWLPFVYAHLFSGAQWQRLTALLRAKVEN